MGTPVTLARAETLSMAPSSSRMLFRKFEAMNSTTSFGTSICMSSALRRTMAIRVSISGCSIWATSPHLKRLTRRSWSVGISAGGASLDTTIWWWVW